MISDELFDDCVLDHIAVATSDLEKSVGIFSELGLKFKEAREVVEEQKVKTAFAPIDEHASLELLEPTSDESPIAKYINKKGAGIHHICFRVKNIELKQSELRAKGFQFIYENTVTGAHDCLVNFIHPRSTGGILIELSQPQIKA